jgi:transcriptional regulator with XRE-family HTH domain
MTLGKKFKELRMLSNFSQPELSEKVNIEQSYLSKLENDKSVPSSEVFMKLLSVYDLSVEEFLHGFDINDDRKRLSQIPEIENYLNSKYQNNLSKQRSYLYTCSLLIITAVTLFYIGFSKQIFDETVYYYKSDGVVMTDEPKDIFRSWHSLMSVEADHEDVIAKRLEMNKRSDKQIITSLIKNGQQFEIEVKGGYRYYYFVKDEQVSRPINAWLKVIGVMLFMAGVMGFVLERKFYRNLRN